MTHKKNLVWPDYVIWQDYLAIAISDLSIYYIEERWVSMHGSVTEEEMLIPLIVLNKSSQKEDPS